MHFLTMCVQLHCAKWPVNFETLENVYFWIKTIENHILTNTIIFLCPSATEL